MEYKVTINGKPITRVINVQTIDREGAMADDIRVAILNDETAPITKGSDLAVSFGGYRSGEMVVDRIESGTRTTVLGAISTPVSKEKKTRHYSKVRFFDVVNDVALSCGFSVSYYGVENHYYENVTQFQETCLAFLNRLCTREGYSLKVDNKRLVIYSKAFIEANPSAKTITLKDVIDNQITFSDNPNKVGSVTVKYYADRLIEYTAVKDTVGERKTIIEYATVGEAERFAKGYLSAFTQNDITVDALILLTDGLASGNCVTFENFGRFSGKYFIYECCHNPEKDQTRLIGRKL